jgi:hypothetical protein
MMQQVYSISPSLESKQDRSTGHTDTLSYTNTKDGQRQRSAERGNEYAGEDQSQRGENAARGSLIEAEKAGKGLLI